MEVGCQNKPLSQYGVGPYYAGLVFGVTVGALVLNHLGALPVVRLWIGEGPQRLLAVFFWIVAAAMWFNAVITTKIAQHIRQNELDTFGAYRWVRNPIYSAIMLAMWGLLLWSGNLLLLVLCPVYHLLMAVMVKCTEERWLKERYGQAYLNYCNRVNRCLPWFHKRDSES